MYCKRTCFGCGRISLNNNLLLFVVRRPFRCRHDVTLLSVELSWVWSVKHTFCFPKPKGDIYFTGSHSMWHNRKRHVGVSRLRSDNFQRIATCGRCIHVLHTVHFQQNIMLTWYNIKDFIEYLHVMSTLKYWSYTNIVLPFLCKAASFTAKNTWTNTYAFALYNSKFHPLEVVSCRTSSEWTLLIFV